MFALQTGLQVAGLSAEVDTVLVEAIGWGLAGALLLGWAVIATSGEHARIGWLWAGLLVGAIVQGLAPPAAPVIAWPVVVACAAAAVSKMGRRLGWLAAVIAAPGVAFTVYLSHLAFLSLVTPLPLALFPWLTVLLLAPLIGRQRPV